MNQHEKQSLRLQSNTASFKCTTCSQFECYKMSELISHYCKEHDQDMEIVNKNLGTKLTFLCGKNR